MTKFLTGFAVVASITGMAFWRCGMQFSPEGNTVEIEKLDAGVWDILIDDPWLKVSPAPAPDEDDSDTQHQGGLTDALVDVIRGLPADGFDASGKPKVDALKAALPERAGEINAKVRDAVWAVIAASAGDAGTGDAGTGNAGAGSA
jgi:hypothetical protein